MTSNDRTRSGAARVLPLPETTIDNLVAVSAKRYPSREALVYYGRTMTYAALDRAIDALASYLRDSSGLEKGARVLVYLQNCPQFVIAFHAILRAGAVVVPVNPMSKTAELEHCIADAGVTFAFAGNELIEPLLPLLGTTTLRHVISVAYGQYADLEINLSLPAVVNAQPPMSSTGITPFEEALGSSSGTLSPCAPDDLALILYTSGTTGVPKGCMHSHRTLMGVAASAGLFNRLDASDTMLAAVPMFHVTGIQMVMNPMLYLGGRLVIMTRWDREVALALIQRENVTAWLNVPTMVVDLLVSPNATASALSTLRFIGGGGAAMPEAVAARLYELTGLSFIEGYGLTETASATHMNPVDRPKRQCLGIPVPNVVARVIDPETLKSVESAAVGELVMHGPQICLGYWRNQAATAAAFIDLDGMRFFRSGDLGYVDEDGYFFMVDRLKRMINASGFKVWPAEVELSLYAHPAIREACVVGSEDRYRGETVKAIVVLRDEFGHITAEEIRSWISTRIAAYKVPSSIAFMDELPKSPTGKIEWRKLQDLERAQVLK